MVGGRTLQRNYYSFKELKGLYNLSTDSKRERRETGAKLQRASRLSI